MEKQTKIKEHHDNNDHNVANAEAEHKVSHEHTIYSEPIANIGGFTVTNSLFSSWIAVVLIVVFSLVFRSRIKKVPGTFQIFFEMLVEKFLDIFDLVTGSRSKTEKFFPLAFAFFTFILINNWLGLFPGVGSIGHIVEDHGHSAFVPLFRGGTADLNTTLALALIGVMGSHLASIFFLGSWTYMNKFINIKSLLEIPGKIKKDPTIVFVNPVKIFIGLIEIVGEMAKVASLSFRLFGNIFAGEVLIGSIAAIFAFGIPLPFMFLEVLVGFIQAFIFSILVLLYFSMMTSDEH